jgi:hypothetical protein
VRTSRIDDLSNVFLMCRTVGHAWQPQVTYVEQHGRRTLHRGVWVCEREKAAGVTDATEKEVLSFAKGRSAGGLFETPRYRYADGYLVSEKLGRGRQRPVARLALMDRLVQEPSAKKERNGLKAVE